MEHNLTNKILETIKEGVLGTGDVVLAFLETPYGASGKQMQRKLEEVERRRERFCYELRERQKFYNLLSRLKKDGLILKENDKWRITKRGDNKIQNIREKYQKKEDKTFKIIAFDIPEKKRACRDWLRSILPDLGFNFMQKSLWVGKVSVPERFLNDLRIRGILDNVQIFEITKAGTFSELT